MCRAVAGNVRLAFPTIAAIAVALASSVVLTLSGCASSAGIAPHTPPLDPVRAGLPAAVEATPLHLATDWWRSFDDPTLDALVDRALADHPDLQTAQARLERAGAAVAGARAAEGPQVNGAADATRQRYSEHGLLPPPLAGSTHDSGTVQATASWELDFFGRQRAELQSALGQIGALSPAEARNVKVRHPGALQF